MAKHSALLLLLVACSDGPTAAGDAAACACAPAEPPLGGRLVRVEGRRTGTSRFLDATATCAAGELLLGGGCYLDRETSPLTTLSEAGRPVLAANDFRCVWSNDAMTELTGVAWATCLAPAP